MPLPVSWDRKRTYSHLGTFYWHSLLLNFILLRKMNIPATQLIVSLTLLCWHLLNTLRMHGDAHERKTCKLKKKHTESEAVYYTFIRITYGPYKNIPDLTSTLIQSLHRVYLRQLVYRLNGPNNYYFSHICSDLCILLSHIISGAWRHIATCSFQYI